MDVRVGPKNWCFWTVMLEKTPESPLDCKEIQPVHPKGDQSWVFFVRTDAEAETPILWPPDAKADSFEKTMMLGKIEGRRRGRQRMRWLDGITDSMDMSLSNGSWWWTGKPDVLQSMGLQKARHDWALELNWNSTSSKWKAFALRKPMWRKWGDNLQTERKYLQTKPDEGLVSTIHIELSKLNVKK